MKGKDRELIIPGLLWLVRADFRTAYWGSGTGGTAHPKNTGRKKQVKMNE